MKLKEQSDHLEVKRSGNVMLLLGVIFVVLGVVSAFAVNSQYVVNGTVVEGEEAELLSWLVPTVVVVIGLILALLAKNRVIKLRKNAPSSYSTTGVITRRTKEKSIDYDDIAGVSIETRLEHQRSNSSSNNRNSQRVNSSTVTYYRLELEDGNSIQLGSRSRKGIWDTHIGIQNADRIADYLRVDLIDSGVERPVGMYRSHRGRDMFGRKGRGRLLD